MSKYKFLYLFWLIPAYLLFLTLHQVSVYYGIIDTYENGSSYTAEIVEFDLKQIAAQTNGYVVLKFKPENGEQIRQKLSLPVEMAGEIQGIKIVPIRYQQGARQNIVMMPTYSTHKNLVLTNIGMGGVAFLMTFVIGIFVNRYVKRRVEEGEEEIVYERVDADE
jgi:hypothetical protein